MFRNNSYTSRQEDEVGASCNGRQPLGLAVSQNDVATVTSYIVNQDFVLEM